MHTAESEFLKFMIEYEYMGEIEIIFENTLALLSGAQMGLHHENRKSRDTLPHEKGHDGCRKSFILGWNTRLKEQGPIDLCFIGPNLT